jgi:hypothetical protein
MNIANFISDTTMGNAELLLFHLGHTTTIIGTWKRAVQPEIRMGLERVWHGLATSKSGFELEIELVQFCLTRLG